MNHNISRSIEYHRSCDTFCQDLGGDGGGQFHTQIECISRIIKFDSKEKQEINTFCHKGNFWLGTLIPCIGSLLREGVTSGD
jgi:hypothetical protein